MPYVCVIHSRHPNVGVGHGNVSPECAGFARKGRDLPSITGGQHEKVGVFRAIQKLQQLFRARHNAEVAEIVAANPALIGFACVHGPGRRAGRQGGAGLGFRWCQKCIGTRRR
jgi:hypothetical protein